MQSMALGMAATRRRKTSFPTAVTDSYKKAKPTTAAMAICVYIILYYVLLQITPSANRNSYRVAKHYHTYTHATGATHINPGLGKRNSYTAATGPSRPP